jgi:hypothetical protein
MRGRGVRMDMEARTRLLSTTSVFGEVYTVENGYHETLGVSSKVVQSNRCWDFHKKKKRSDGSLPTSDCDISKAYSNPLFMNRSTGFFRFSNYAVDFGPVAVSELNTVRPPRNSSARNAENGVLALQLLAATNPNRDEFSIPVFAKELIELSSLFKFAAKSFVGFVGGAYLNYKFGWTQFLRDIQTLHKITTAIERRIKEFKSLELKGGLRRSRVHLMSKASSWDALNVTLHSSWGVTLRCKVRGRNVCQTTGSVRWRYKPGYDNNLYKLQGFNHAVRAVLDLDSGGLDSKTVWNMIPFSWLIDYFVDLNTYLGAHAGGVAIEPYDICIVRRGRSRYTEVVTTKPDSISISGPTQRGVDIIERDMVSVGSLSLPTVSILSGWELVTVAALFASFKR